jgi:FAD/FMN-containing dehydrogenase
VGGFITGEGGFSWKTNQYGLTIDTLIQADVVLPNGDIVVASQSSNPDLFFVIKGGGNRFGIVLSFRLATHPQSKTVYGGLRTYLWNELPAMAKAVSK